MSDHPAARSGRDLLGGLYRRPDDSNRHVTVSGQEIPLVATPADVADLDYARDLGDPGQYPYTRGIHADMYRGKLWTMRQFAGFGTAEQTNERYRFLLARGQTGLSVAFDLPTLMGRDSDDPWSAGEVGKCGVAISSLEDMETLFAGIPLADVSTSMTINSPAAIIWAMYIAAAENQGADRAKLRGTLQNDILKEFIAQKEFIFPPVPSLKLVVDTIEFASREMPLFNPISISGYHIREAGSTAVQELAFTLADGFAYVDAAIAAGLDVDEFAPRLSFFFNSHLDLFEEIAKFRAARRIWARHLRERYGARNPRSWLLRFHTQTAGCSLTAQQPQLNVVRTAYQALAGVLGGTQSLHTNSLDEALALPSEEAVEIALRTQQILAHEIGVASTIDPLAGSYFVEKLTTEMEAGAEAYFARIAEVGGVIPALEEGFFQREIADAAHWYQQALERKQRVVVGVNEYVNPDEKQQIPLLRIDKDVARSQERKLAALRARRDEAAVRAALGQIETAARDGANLMPRFLDAVRAYATLGEIVGALKAVYGEYTEPIII
ncbi:MAG TPA: methylmalonyl-CoA mutase family protein [Candidatus Krumholzibacteria bacterium]|nr:methylmalonyl-CoA mutase family protein [Candidatus Krumholzibacteria bacterium]HPD70176.1 methylmalonyl-CoA mutase family protein [Candidatus Krumholzibacteria bacterium]HRY40124.1 methylmalonyl-CoA mutase family protein [Candidatus Krumholzibacteria bacterium]